MIGIVGGVGPLAGVDILKKIIEETKACTDQEHVPVALLSIPESISDRTQFLIRGKEKNPALAISKMFMQLEQMGATVGAIPCNTAHAQEIYSVINEEMKKMGSKLKLINIINECLFYLEKYFPLKTVGILSTNGTKLSGVYRNAFKRVGINFIEAEGRWQERIQEAIYDNSYGIKAFSSPVKEKARQELYAVIEMLVKAGSEVIILGCSEIPLAIKEDVFCGVPLINPIRVLARALIKEVAPEKLKEESSA